MPHRRMSEAEIAAAQQLFDRIISAGGAFEEGDTEASHTLRIWESCAAAVIEPAPPRRDPRSTSAFDADLDDPAPF